MIVSIVEVGIAVAFGGTVVGSGVEVGSLTGTSVAVQAVRMIKKTMMSFFMMNNYMPTRGDCLPEARFAGASSPLHSAQRDMNLLWCRADEIERVQRVFIARVD